MLYSLDFEEDPLGDLLYIDYLALRAREYQWIIDFFEAFNVSTIYEYI